MAPEPALSSAAIAEADAFAAAAHEGQVRNYNGRPYIEHPRRVAGLVREAGLDPEAVAAALLHDVVEDTDVEASEIRARFGERIADLVAALTEDPAIEPYEERKDAHRRQVIAAGHEPVVIYAADKLSNVRDLGARYAEEGEAVATRFKTPLDLRLALWDRDVSELGELEPRPLFVAELASQLEALRAARAAVHNS